MGRHRWTSRLTVEDCPLFLCAASFYRAGTFGCFPGTTSGLTWTKASGECLGRLECRLDYSEPGGLAIYVRRQCPRFNVVVDDQEIPVTTVRPHLGGARFWFVCGCGRRVGRLYLPGQQVFRCRRCYQLTYRSAQTHDQRKYDLARNPVALEAALRSKKHSRALLGIGAFGLLLERRNRSNMRRAGT